jgi:hypothetical protein
VKLRDAAHDVCDKILGEKTHKALIPDLHKQSQRWISAAAVLLIGEQAESVSYQERRIFKYALRWIRTNNALPPDNMNIPWKELDVGSKKI